MRYDFSKMWELVKAQPAERFRWTGLHFWGEQPMAVTKTFKGHPEGPGKYIKLPIPEEILKQCEVRDHDRG